MQNKRSLSKVPPRAEYVTDTSEFQDVKAQLARIENHRDLNDKKNTERPELRRASSGNNSDDDAPPKLSRQDGQQIAPDGQAGN